MTKAAVAADLLQALVVDSDAARAEGLSEVLKNCGYAPVLAEDPMAAQMLLDSEKFDVVLCQEKLGSASGIEVLKHVHATHPEIPFVIMADAADSPIVAEAMGAGAAESFTTPGDYKQLFPKLAALQQQAAATPAAKPKMAAHPIELPEFTPAASKSEPANVDIILDVPVTISAILGNTSMRIADLLQLGPGSVVELDKRAGEPVDLYINDKLVALGEVVVVNETFGVRITEVIDPKQRVQVLN